MRVHLGCWTALAKSYPLRSKSKVLPFLTCLSFYSVTWQNWRRRYSPTVNSAAFPVDWHVSLSFSWIAITKMSSQLSSCKMRLFCVRVDIPPGPTMHSRERISQNLSLDRMLIDFVFRDGKRAILARLVNKLALFSLVEHRAWGCPTYPHGN